MSNFSEKMLVEDSIIQQLQELGWNYVPGDELDREDYREPLLIQNFIRAIEKNNKDLDIAGEEINKVLTELKLAGTGIEGAKKILNFYKFGVPVKFEKEKVVHYVKIFDYENIENNEFIVTNQVIYDGKERIRTDVVLYVNGIPLVNIECKNPTKPGVSWYDAFVQIKDYEKIVPELYKFIQIGVAVESKAKYFPIVSWLKKGEVHTYEWKEKKVKELESQGGGKAKDSIDSIDSSDFINQTVLMLRKDKLLNILKNYLFFRIERGNAGKIITRYMQYRASEKIVERVVEFIESKGQKNLNKGLIWHWQGSGKTFTMIFCASKLFYLKELENPTIFFIVDRIELEEQLYNEFYSLDIVQPEIIGSIDELKEILSYDDYKGKRGIFIVLIHKFRPDELKDLQEEMSEIAQDKETIMTRDNVIAFVDEGHRTQYGILAGQMRSILKNAFFFAFTGTPISKPRYGKDTYEQFSNPPEELYLDRYFITDSIKDGFTVKIVYQPRLEKDVNLKKDWLKVFLETEFEEIPERIRDEVEEKLKRKLNAINLFLENPERIKIIAKDIAEHFKENLDGKFKAMIVTGSRKACALYKEKLNEYLPEKYSEVVMTYEERKDENIKVKTLKEARARYGEMEPGDLMKRIIEKFKEEEYPKVLIVTDMLLTGFDAPILQVMYLDKPLKEHRLLQAIARTNRPFKNLKEVGIIIDYIGILKEFKKALKMYSTEDIKGVLLDYNSLKKEFITLIEEILKMFEGIPRNYKRETLLRAVEILTTDEEKGEEFLEKYRNLRKIFELLGPGEVKLEYFDIYKWISGIYTYYIKVVIQVPEVKAFVHRYFEKTVKFVHKTTEIEKLERELPVITFDENYLGKLEKKVKSKKEKAASILFTLQRFILVDRHRNPVYESLVDRVEKMVEMWKEKTKDYERIYREGIKILKNMDELSERQERLGFNNLEYSFLLVLKNKIKKEKELVQKIKGISAKLEKYIFPGWLSQVTTRKEVEREIRRFVRGLKSEYEFSFAEMDKLHKKLIDRVKNYGE